MAGKHNTWLGDDGELDIDLIHADGHGSEDSTTSKPKRLLRARWPVIALAISALLPIIPLLVRHLAGLPDLPIQFDHPVNYPLLIAFHAATMPLFWTILLITLVAGGVWLMRRQGCGSKLLGLALLIGLSTFSCWLYNLSYPTYHFQHLDSLASGDHRYHLTAATANWNDHIHFYLLFECNTAGMSCRQVYVSEMLTDALVSEENPRLSLGEQSNTIRVRIILGSDILHSFGISPAIP